MALGFASILGWLLFGLTTVTRDLLKNHRDYDERLAAARYRMQQLGLNIEKIDASYERVKKLRVKGLLQNAQITEEEEVDETEGAKGEEAHGFNDSDKKNKNLVPIKPEPKKRLSEKKTNDLTAAFEAK